MTNQPVWRKIGTVGDINPVDFGGGVVFEDTTGVYGVEVEYYDPINPDRDESPVRVYRFTAEKCTFVNGVLSDNKYHPEHGVWFEYNAIADQYGGGVDFIGAFCSDNGVDRAWAWYEVGMYHGFDELDQYPLNLTYDEAMARLESNRQ